MSAGKPDQLSDPTLRPPLSRYHGSGNDYTIIGRGQIQVLTGQVLRFSGLQF